MASITTVALIKAFGNVGSAVDNADATLVLCRDAAERMCEQYVGFRFGAAAAGTIEYFDQNKDQRRIPLGRVNIATSPAIDVRYDAAWSWATGNKLDSSAYVLDTENGILTLLTDYPENLRAWKITYQATGWDSTTAPFDLVLAVTALADFLYGKAKSGNFGQVDDAIGQNQANHFEKMIPNDIKAILDSWKRCVYDV